MRRKQKPSAVVPALQKLHEIAEGTPLNWPADDTPAAPHHEAATSAENRLRDQALRAQDAQRNQPFFPFL